MTDEKRKERNEGKMKKKIRGRKEKNICDMNKYNKEERQIKKINQNGITLVALVVTIIVLLILAGVSINMVIGENGIIVRSKEAAEKHKVATVNEEKSLKEWENAIDNYLGNGTGGGEMPEGWDKDKVSSYTDDDGKKVPIPDGFTVDESQGKTVQGGIVIKDNVGNEFVWIPVSDTTSMFDEVNNAGQLYNFTENTANKKTYSSTDYREPSYLTETACADGSSYNTVGITQNVLETEFEKMKASVEKYGGFYIGRYETGNLSAAKAVVQKGNIDISNQNWYTMYRLGREMYSTSTSVESSMIWGCQWDQVMIWMKEVPNRTNPSKYYITDSRDMGNYYDITFTYTDTSGIQQTKGLNAHVLIPTGSTEISRVKNIYDMAGNVDEWTFEAYSSNSRVFRRWSLGFQFQCCSSWHS